MKITIMFLATLLFMATAGADDARKTVDELKMIFIKMGEPRIEGVEKSGDIIAPVIYFGKHKINNTFTVVDKIKQTSGAYSTVFVKDGNEFIRISTNVLTPRGVRGVGTKLAHNQAYNAAIKGEVYCGEIDILGNSFYTCYDPFKDKAGKVIGIYLIGFKK